MFFLLGPALSPPSNYDTLEYHLGVVPHYFAERRITPIPHVFYSAQPLATEMLYTLGAIMEGTPRGLAPRTVSWSLVVLSAILLFRALLAVGTTRSIAPWLVLVYLVHPIIFKLEWDRVTDLTGAIFLLGGLLVATTPADGKADSNAPKNIFLIGIFVGAAVASKWTNAGTAALILTMASLLGLFIPGKRDWKISSTYIGLFFLGAVLILLPWQIWLWVQAGNPFAPFAAGIFPTDSWSPARLQFLMQTHGPLSLFSLEYWMNLLTRLNSGSSGPPIMIFAVGIWLLAWLLERRRIEEIRPASSSLINPLFLGVAAASILWGRLRFAADRFLAPVIVTEIVILGAALGRLLRPKQAGYPDEASAANQQTEGLIHSSRGQRPRSSDQKQSERPEGASQGWTEGVAIFLLALSSWPYAFGEFNLIRASAGWDYALEKINDVQYLRGIMGGTVDLFSAANALPADSRIVAVAEARSFYFRRPIALSSVFDQSPLRPAIARASTAEQIRQGLIAQGYTHLLVNEYEMVRLLVFHPPPILLADETFLRARGQGEKSEPDLVKQYAGYVEFGVEPLSAEERAAYREFLSTLRERAVFFDAGPQGSPAMWIAPLK